MSARNIELVEVGPRDGLQNEKAILSTADKVALIERSVAAGVRRIEVASFVHPGRVPQMADAEEVCRSLRLPEEVETIGLVLNRRGLERALETSVGEIGAVVSASDGFGMANQGRSSAQTVTDAVEVMQLAQAAGRKAQCTISMAFGCPFDGEISSGLVVQIARQIAAARPREIALADTIGIARPEQVTQLVQQLRAELPDMPLRLHFHDTRGLAVGNALAGLTEGVKVFDGAVGGAGGCPFAPGSSGNVATEDLLALFAAQRRDCGVDAEAVAKITPWLFDLLGREPTAAS